MIIFLQLNAPLGLPAGKYLFDEKHLKLPAVTVKLLQEHGVIAIREATWNEQTLFMENLERGEGYTVLETFTNQDQKIFMLQTTIDPGAILENYGWKPSGGNILDKNYIAWYEHPDYPNMLLRWVPERSRFVIGINPLPCGRSRFSDYITPKVMNVDQLEHWLSTAIKNQNNNFI